MITHATIYERYLDFAIIEKNDNHEVMLKYMTDILISP